MKDYISSNERLGLFTNNFICECAWVLCASIMMIFIIFELTREVMYV